MIAPASGPCGSAEAAAGRRRGVWPAATLVASAFGVPTGLLLSHLGLLPFYLGLFFFVLFGMVLGAVQYRLGRATAPLGRTAVVSGAAVVVVIVWGVAIFFESRHLRTDAARFVVGERRRLTQEQARELQRATAARVDEFLATGYPPGGTVGYVRWAVRSGRMPIGETDGHNPLVYKLRQGPLGWSLRAVVSAVLLFFGVYSQVAPLSRPPGAGGGDTGTTVDDPPGSNAV